MVSQSEIKCVFKVLDIFRTASPFSRVHFNKLLLCTPENGLSSLKYLEYFKNQLFHFGKPPRYTLLLKTFRHHP